MKKLKVKDLPYCSCGCGEKVTKKGNKFILGHNVKMDDPAVNAVKSHQWKRGQSGNKNGSKTGSRNKVSLAVDDLMLKNVNKLSEKAVSLALEGNVAMLIECLARIAPKPKSKPIKINGMPVIKHVEDIPKLTNFILSRIGKGKISVADGEIISRIIEKHSKGLELSDLSKRFDMLEERLELNQII